MRVAQHLAFVILAAIVTLAVPVTVYADVSTSDIKLYDVQAFQNVVEPGDILVLVRDNLVASPWRSNTCAQVGPCLTTTTCTNVNDYLDPCYTTLISGMATVTLFDDLGNVVAVRDMPRIGPGLAGVYLCASPSTLTPPCAGELASAFPFNDPTKNVQVCIMGPTTLGPRPSVCFGEANIIWHPVTDPTSEESLLETENFLLVALIPMMKALAASASVTVTTWVDGQVITNIGAIFPLEAFPPLTTIVPAAFASAVLNSVVPGYNPTPPTAPNSLPNQATAAQAGGLYRISAAIGSGLSTTGTWFGNLAAFVVAVIIFVVVMKYDGGKPASAAAAAWIVLLDFALYGLFGWAILFTFTLLAIIGGSMQFAREHMP